MEETFRQHVGRIMDVAWGIGLYFCVRGAVQDLLRLHARRRSQRRP